MTSFFDLISEIFIKFLVDLPDASDFNLDGSLASIRALLGYMNWFIPMDTINIIFSAWTFTIGLVTFGFLLVRLVRDSIPF